MTNKKQKTKQRPVQDKRPVKKTGPEKITDPEKTMQDKLNPLELKKRTPEEMFRLGELTNLLVAEPELAGKLAEALETGRFFVTVTFNKKYDLADRHDLHHYWIKKDFMTQDIVHSLNHIMSDFNAKEQPGAELPDKKSWH